MNDEIVMEVRNLKKYFPIKAGMFGRVVGQVRAVDGVSFRIRRGTTMGLVGESGCGKTTLARTLLGLQRESTGVIRLEGATVSGQEPGSARTTRATVQYVHQDPGAALDPWWRVGATLAEGLRIHGVAQPAERQARIAEMLTAVGLDPAMAERYPHELSGGQQRRIGLARILLLRPKVVILDEPTAGLDPQGEELLLAILGELKLTTILISHDLFFIGELTERTVVMHRGTIIRDYRTSEFLTDGHLHSINGLDYSYKAECGRRILALQGSVSGR